MRIHLHHKTLLKPLDKINGCDPSTFPPCKSVRTEKNVAHFIKRASYRNPFTWNLINHGWELKNGKQIMKWYEGKQVPDTVSVHMDESNLNESEEEREVQYANESDE